MASSNSHGTIYWLEIPVLSAARAAAFYAAVLGWECDVLPSSLSSSSSSSSSSSTITNGGTNTPTTTPPATTTTIHTFRRGGGTTAATTTTTTASTSTSTSTAPVRGAFIQVPEDRLVRAWDDGDGDGGRAAVLTTFAVGSIEGALGRVAEMGGRTHLPKTAIGGNMGYFARFIDSEGNLQGIWAQS